MADGTCSADACARTKLLARGMCATHYKMWWKQNRDVVAADKAARSTTCSVEGCGARNTSRGWCKHHYRQWLKTGDPTFIAAPWRGQPCRVEGCPRPNEERGLCATHAYRLRTRGDVGSPDLERSRSLIHGTVTGYKHRKCRCPECCEAKRLYDLNWRAANRQTQRDMQTRYRASNPDRVQAYRRRWKLSNPDKVRGWDPLRAAVPVDSDALAYCQILKNDPCVYCGAPSTDIEHIVPVSVSRSSHWTNLAAACDGCNSSKGAKPLLSYLMYRQRRAALAAS